MISCVIKMTARVIYQLHLQKKIEVKIFTKIAYHYQYFLAFPYPDVKNTHKIYWVETNKIIVMQASLQGQTNEYACNICFCSFFFTEMCLWKSTGKVSFTNQFVTTFSRNKERYCSLFKYISLEWNKPIHVPKVKLTAKKKRDCKT